MAKVSQQIRTNVLLAPQQDRCALPSSFKSGHWCSLLSSPCLHPLQIYQALIRCVRIPAVH